MSRASRIVISCAATLLAVTSAACTDPVGGGPLSLGEVTRRPLADGVELIEGTIQRGGNHAGKLHAIYADLAKVDADIVINEDRLGLPRVAPDTLAVMNAGFFTPDWKPTGLLVSGGKRISGLVPRGGAAGSGVLLLKNGKLRLKEREHTKREDLQHVAMGIQAGPRLIENGGRPGIRSDDGKRGHRTFIGADQRGRLVMGVVLGPGSVNSGPTLFELQGVLTAAGLGRSAHAELGLAFALNLDGGSSSGMVVRHPDHGRELPEAAAVYSVLALTVKK